MCHKTLYYHFKYKVRKNPWPEYPSIRDKEENFFRYTLTQMVGHWYLCKVVGHVLPTWLVPAQSNYRTTSRKVSRKWRDLWKAAIVHNRREREKERKDEQVWWVIWNSCRKIAFGVESFTTVRSFCDNNIAWSALTSQIQAHQHHHPHCRLFSLSVDKTINSPLVT